MNIYLVLSRTEPAGETPTSPPWTLNAFVFESQDDAVTWAEANCTGQTWRVVMLPSVSVLQ